MAYDHNKHAGNEGDICKHPALIAALDKTLARSNRRAFKYADLFAGYAQNPLRSTGEWRQGIGVIAGKRLLNRNSHVAIWAKCAGLDVRPGVDANYPGYPGSAWFAQDVCNKRRRRVEFWLWETASAPHKNLRSAFPRAHVVKRSAFPKAHVVNTPADYLDSAIHNADFVFIDPPSKSHWRRISGLLRCLDPKQAVLVWLPLGANTRKTPPVEDGLSLRCRKEALEELGMGVSSIRWAKGGHTIGCQLLYRLNANARHALIAAVERIIHLAQLSRGKSPKWSYSPDHF